ncbi:hypothetical protein EDB83DRAFT_2313272 [Lactarius deliciosus]|nr:hypothetical protein EDB83DRAFT_2313272 [Lactarius deliciosus]
MTGQCHLLTSWADFLSNATLLNHDQWIIFDLCGWTDETNLAIKGIIAIKAMSRMSSILKRADDVDQYSNIAANLYAQWKTGTTSSNHPSVSADSCLVLTPIRVGFQIYDGQSSFLDNLLLTSNFSDSGVPVDNFGWDTRVRVSSWDLFVTAMTPNQDLRTNLISRDYNRELKGSNDVFTPTLLGDPWAQSHGPGRTAIRSSFNYYSWQECGHIFIRSSGTSIKKQLWAPEMHEIQQLPAERSESHLESPPSYATRGDRVA